MMDFEQNFWKKYIWINLQNHPSDQPILAKRKNLQCELSSIWMNASNEEEISESFSFTDILASTENTIFIWYTRHFEYSCMRCSWTIENDN